MTLQPTANRQDVFAAGGIRGYETHLINATPSPLSTTTTGSAAASNNDKGLELDAGATNGDQAKLQSASHYWGRYTGGRFIEIGYMLGSDATDPATDSIEIGLIKGDSGVDATQGAYLSLDDQEYRAGNSNSEWTAAQTPETLQSAVLRIVMDSGTNKTRFEHYSQAFQENILVNTADVAGTDPTITLVESAGNSDNLYVQFVREGFYGNPQHS